MSTREQREKLDAILTERELRAEVKDLKARLKAVRDLNLFPRYLPEDKMTPTWNALHRITDLRVKRWRAK